MNNHISSIINGIHLCVINIRLFGPFIVTLLIVRLKKVKFLKPQGMFSWLKRVIYNSYDRPIGTVWKPTTLLFNFWTGNTFTIQLTQIDT